MRVRKTGERYLIRLEPDEEALTALPDLGPERRHRVCSPLGHRGYAPGRCWAL